MSKKHALENEDEKSGKKQKTGSVTAHPWDDLKYLSGFGVDHDSEALPNALPKGQLMPQKCAYGLYAEQLSGTSFTTPRVHNQRTWAYRIAPTAKHKPFKKIEHGDIRAHFSPSDSKATPAQIRWKPFPMPGDEKKDGKIDFVRGLHTVGGSGTSDLKVGFAIHVYGCNVSMKDSAFCSADGDMLIVPQEGRLRIITEFGRLSVAPTEICVIQRAIRFAVEVDGPSRGYICEVFNGHFRIPDLGPIGANGLANPRDFKTPVAWYEDRKCTFTSIHKFSGELSACEYDHSIFDVVAWTGNYVPYKYSLLDFVPAGAVLKDHMDPSIFTVLTAATAEPGVAVCDFVAFPPRYAVQEHTFRPPYFHRNVMTEFMGNICGRYEAKPDGFLPGGGSLHSISAGHGPDSGAYLANSSKGKLPVQRLPDDSWSFMFESTYFMRLTDWGLKAPQDDNYFECWAGLPREFDPTKPEADIESALKAPAPAAKK